MNLLIFVTVGLSREEIVEMLYMIARIEDAAALEFYMSPTIPDTLLQQPIC